MTIKELEAKKKALMTIIRNSDAVASKTLVEFQQICRELQKRKEADHE